jgi:hypothetical protein
LVLAYAVNATAMLKYQYQGAKELKKYIKKYNNDYENKNSTNPKQNKKK